MIRQYQFNTVAPGRIPGLINEIGAYFWIGYADGVKAGVAYVSRFSDMWFFDAYHDHRVTEQIDKRTAWTYEAGRLVIPYILDRITPVIWTAHDVRNRAATIVCRRLGFEKVNIVNGYIIMRRDKNGY